MCARPSLVLLVAGPEKQSDNVHTGGQQIFSMAWMCVMGHACGEHAADCLLRHGTCFCAQYLSELPHQIMIYLCTGQALTTTCNREIQQMCPMLR